MKKFFEEYFRQYYSDELKRKDEIYQRLNLPISIIIVFCGIIWYFINIIDFTNIDYLSFILLIFTFFQVLGVSFIVYFIIKAYHFTKEYGYVADPETLNNYIIELKEYYSHVEPNKSDESTEKDFREYIYNEYIKYGKLNCKNNDMKSAHIYNANKSIIITLVIFIISSMPFYVLYRKKDNIQKIEIINKLEITAMPDEKPKPTPQQPPQKPTPPPGRLIKEGQLPPTKKP